MFQKVRTPIIAVCAHLFSGTACNKRVHICWCHHSSDLTFSRINLFNKLWRSKSDGNNGFSLNLLWTACVWTRFDGLKVSYMSFQNDFFFLFECAQVVLSCVLVAYGSNMETMTIELWCPSVCNPSVGAETKEKGYPRIMSAFFNKAKMHVRSIYKI